VLRLLQRLLREERRLHACSPRSFPFSGTENPKFSTDEFEPAALVPRFSRRLEFVKQSSDQSLAAFAQELARALSRPTSHFPKTGPGSGKGLLVRHGPACDERSERRESLVLRRLGLEVRVDAALLARVPEDVAFAVLGREQDERKVAAVGDRDARHA